jgi:hypothetical protein
MPDKPMEIVRDISSFFIYSFFQNNIPFKPQDDSVFIGKNSQKKPRKSEQGLWG